MTRWSVEQVAAVAPSPRALAAAEPVATPRSWASAGCDARAVWGRCRGSGAEPYDTVVDHVEAGFRCTCPSRRSPCKHALGLLLRWVRGEVPEAAPPPAVIVWLGARDARAERGRTPGDPRPPGDEVAPDRSDHPEPNRPEPDPAPDAPPDRGDLDRSRDERVARMLAGLAELDRWLEDRMRHGLADPALARYATWDALAARLVDARAGALANRVRRLAGLVGASPEWHSEVLAELGVLHLLAQAGQRLGALPAALADSAAVASGWQVRQADVLATAPDTDDWLVAGRSDVREDRIEVRRVWLRGLTSGEWAMVLSFAAYQQTLDDSLTVGTVVRGDLHRYPGRALRALPGRLERLTERVGPSLSGHADRTPDASVPRGSDPLGRDTSVAGVCDAIGAAVAAEPWLERYPAVVRAAPTVVDGRWVLGDATGALALSGRQTGLAAVLAASAGRPVDLAVEWTPRGVVPLTVFLPGRVLDVGPRADPGFVGRVA